MVPTVSKSEALVFGAVLRDRLMWVLEARRIKVWDAIMDGRRPVDLCRDDVEEFHRAVRQERAVFDTIMKSVTIWSNGLVLR